MACQVLAHGSGEAGGRGGMEPFDITRPTPVRSPADLGPLEVQQGAFQRGAFNDSAVKLEFRDLKNAAKFIGLKSARVLFAHA